MVEDYYNDNVDTISPFETTLQMRRQRMNLVQKPGQYHYMIKCLTAYVKGEISIYTLIFT